MKKLLFVSVFLFSISCFAQKQKNQDRKGYDTDSSWYHKGFEFVIAGGAYFGNKYNAAYYNGHAENENNIFYIFNNKYRYDEINRIVRDAYPFIPDSVFLDHLPSDMRYKVNMSIALGIRYKFSGNWGINLTYSFVRLTASDRFFLKYKNEAGNFRPEVIPEYLLAKENRSMFDLTVSYLFHPHPILKPFLEAGVQFNFVKVKKFVALIEDSEFELLDYYNGGNYVPGVEMTKDNISYGGAGFGVVMSAGLKIAFNKYISIDPVFYLSASSFGLNGYKNMALNYGAYVRIVMSDIVFAK